MLWKRHIPVLIAFLTGVVFALQFYVPHQISQDLLLKANKWMSIIASFVLVLGVISVVQVHYSKVRRQEAGWGYSLIFFISMLVMTAAGAASEGNVLIPGGDRTVYGFMYDFLWAPLSGTMFATLAFYVASAAFRAFRAKTLSAALLLSFAIVFLFGKVPLGEWIWSSIWGDANVLGWKVGNLGTSIEWMMNHINLPARRAIIIGVALGVIATSLKVIFGVERTYMGGRGD